MGCCFEGEIVEKRQIKLIWCFLGKILKEMHRLKFCGEEQRKVNFKKFMYKIMWIIYYLYAKWMFAKIYVLEKICGIYGFKIL